MVAKTSLEGALSLKLASTDFITQKYVCPLATVESLNDVPETNVGVISA